MNSMILNYQDWVLYTFYIAAQTAAPITLITIFLLFENWCSKNRSMYIILRTVYD